MEGRLIGTKPARPVRQAPSGLSRHLKWILAAAALVVVVGGALLYRAQERAKHYDEAFKKGMTLWAQRDAEHALAQFQKAALIDDQDPELWVLMGRCNVVSGQADQASKAWEDALKRRPGYAPALFERGKEALGRHVARRVPPPVDGPSGWLPLRLESAARVDGGAEEAKQILTDLREAAPFSPAFSKFARGAIFLLDGKYTDAPQGFQEYSDLNAWDATAIGLVGIADYYAALPNRAERALTEALTRRAEKSWLKVRADAKYLQGNYEGAKQDYREAGLESPGEREALAPLAGMRRTCLDGFEIGNEPDLYSNAVWFTDRRGRQFFARPQTYGFTNYLLDVNRWRSALPPVTFIGPALAQLTWLNEIDQIQAAEPGLPMVTVHRYPLRACPTPPTSPQFATIPNLLSDLSSSGMAARMAPFISLVHSRGLQFRVDELNSVSCSGKRGVSDTFASALWMLDTLFNFASVGVDSINVHTLPGAAYELFTISHRKNVWQAFVHPEYYAMLMFSQAFPPGAHLLSVTAPGGPVKVWATRAPDGHIRVVIINKDPNDIQTVQVSVPGAAQASLDWLRAPSVLATTGVTLGSQSFGAATRSGLLGPAETDPITAAGGTYTVELPAASAVMLTQ